MRKSIFVKTAIASLAFAGAGAVRAQEKPTVLYVDQPVSNYTTPLVSGEPFAIATTATTSASPRAQYVAVAKGTSLRLCLISCRTETFVQVDAWNDTTTELVPVSASASAVVAGGLAAVAATGLDSGRVVTAGIDGTGVLSIKTWTVGASGVALQNSYSTAIESASPQVAIATLSSTEVVTAYALPSGTLAVEAFTIDATGLPTPVSTVGYQNGDLTSNQVLPAQNGVFASQVSIAAVNANQVITAIADSSESMWVTTWGVNSGVQAQQLQQIPNVVGSYSGSVAVGAGQESVLVPGIGLRPPHVETVQSAFTPCSTAEGTMNVLYWTVSATGQLTQQPAVTPTPVMSNVAATMLPANVPITSYHSAPGIDQTEEFYHGYFPLVDFPGGDPWATNIGYFPGAVPIDGEDQGPLSSASEGSSGASAVLPYNSYFVTASEDPYANTLYVNVFSYLIPPIV